MKNLSSFIDHTLLKPDCLTKDILKLCAEARDYSFFSVCINPVWIPLAHKELAESTATICTVVGFPLGACLAKTKAFEAEAAINLGAREIDMVINISALKDGNWSLVKTDIESVVKSTTGHIVKVIVETCLLTDEEKSNAAKIVMESGAHYIKTSTGFNGPGAQLNDIKLFKSILGDSVKIKASGGIKNKDQAVDFIAAGAERLGTSSGVQLVSGLNSKGEY